MKKLLYLVLSLLVVLSPAMVEAKKTTKPVVKREPVKVHIFYRDGCPHCADLHAYTDELKNDKTINQKFVIVDHNVVTEKESADLMSKVSYYFDKKVATGVPYYVVGEKSYSGFGTAETSGVELKKAILEEYENKDYKDIVADIVSGAIEVVIPVPEEDTSSDTIAYVILGITVVIVIAILFGRSSDEEKIEEKKEPEKKATKKIVKKTTKK